MATRRPFSSQSTLYILLDYVDEEKMADLELIYKALEETIVVGGGVVGATRLPGVGMGALGTPFQRLLKLTAIRNNLPAVLSSMSHVLDGLMPSQQETEMNLEVSAALDAIVTEADTFTPAIAHPLQVLVLTWRPVHLLTETITLCLTHAHAKYLRAVHVVGIVSVLHPDTEDDLPAGDAPGGVWVTGATYTSDPYTFTSLFKSWLSETKGSDPHVLLTFPAINADETPLTLYLDLQEIMIDPLSLPSAIASRLVVHNNIYRTVSSTQGSTLPVVELEVVKRVSGSNLAAALFGQSNYLVPTGATSLSFDEIWENKQYITCLTRQLSGSDEGLLARVIAPPGTLSALVAVLPTQHSPALSMVHVVPAELILPERNLEVYNSQVGLPEKVTKEVEKKLANLGVSELRFEDHNSQLIQTLTQHFTKLPRGGTARVQPTNVKAAIIQPVAGPRGSQQAGRGQNGSGSANPTHQHPAFAYQQQPEQACLAPRNQRGYPRGRGYMGQRAIAAFHMNRNRSSL